MFVCSNEMKYPVHGMFLFQASPVIEHIMKIFPNFVKVQDLPGDDLDYKVSVRYKIRHISSNTQFSL